MATGFSQADLERLQQQMSDGTPPIPKAGDKASAPRVTAIRASGTDLGMLFRFEFKTGQTALFFLNCVVAKEFAAAINAASQHFGWSKKGLKPAPSAHVAHPQPEDLPGAAQVIALATYGAASGMLVNFLMLNAAPQEAAMTFYFPRIAALEFMTLVVDAGNTAKWWDANFELIPSRATQN